MGRADYATEPKLVERVFTLLEATWTEWFLAQARAGERWGLDWAACSTPFVKTEADRVIAHVGLLECETILARERVVVGGVHAVATSKDHRRRGHYRALMDELLAYAEGRYPLLVLTTDGPSIYEPFGFRTVPEHRFVGPAPAPAARAAPARTLDAAKGAGVALLQRLFAEREPLSELCAPLRPDVYYFVEARSTVRYWPDLDAVGSYVVDGEGCLHLHDVVAPRLPTLSEIVAACGGDIERVACYFEPSRLDASLAPEPHRLGGDDHLMVRGDWPLDAQPFMWPRTMRW